MFDRISVARAAAGTRPYDFAVVDEAQDLGVAEARFLAALGAGRPNALFFAGDLGQRIFQTPFSWKSLGIDIRGRSSTLRVNYRTSHQIRTRADRLLPTAISDVDGNEEGRKGTVSVFNGPPPAVRTFKSVQDEFERNRRMDCRADQGRNSAGRDRHFRSIRCGTRPREGGGEGGRSFRNNAIWRDRSGAGNDRGQSDASRQRSRIPRGRGHGLRR